MSFFPTFSTSFSFCYIALICRMGWTTTAKTAIIGRRTVLFLCYIQPCQTSLHFVRYITIDCFSARSIAWFFSITSSSVRLGSCSKRQLKQLGEHLSMKWFWIPVFWSAISYVEASLQSLVTKLIDGLFVSWIAWRNTCLSNATLWSGCLRHPLQPCLSYQRFLNA